MKYHVPVNKHCLKNPEVINNRNNHCDQPIQHAHSHHCDQSSVGKQVENISQETFEPIKNMGYDKNIYAQIEEVDIDDSQAKINCLMNKFIVKSYVHGSMCVLQTWDLAD